MPSREALKYKLIYKHFEDRISSGVMKPGEQFPTEEEISNLFNVSRVTVRKALDELAYRDLVIKKHSKGSFVKKSTESMCLDNLLSFTEEMKKKGLNTKTQVIDVELESAGEYIGAKLDIDGKSKVYVIKRLRYVEDEPMAIEKVIVSYFHCPDIIKYNLEGSLYSIFEKEYGIKLTRANEILQAVPADKKEAQILEIEANSPVLKIERNSFTENKIPLEYAISVYRGDKYKFRVTLDK